MKDPYTGVRTADLIWVPEHDTLSGPNVIKTPLTPHRVTAAKLAAARAEPLASLARLPRPRVALLIGGNSVNHRFTRADIAALSAKLDRLAQGGNSLIETLSRRTAAPCRQGDPPL